MRKTKSLLDLMDFKRKKNYATFVMNQARKAFYKKFADENCIYQGRLSCLE